jgi:DNA-binding MarR family transcriptional regulator
VRDSPWHRYLFEQVIFTVYLYICYADRMNSAPRTDEAALASILARDLRAVVGKLKRRLREQANIGDLTPSQVSVLLRLEKDGPATTSGLARAEGMRPQSMAPVVAALEAAGLVRGAADPGDGRQTLLSLTDACRKWVEEGRAARQDWLTRALQAHLSPREQGEVAAAVALLKRLVED